MDLVSGFCLRRTFAIDRKRVRLLGRYVGRRCPRRDNEPVRALESQTAPFLVQLRSQRQVPDRRSVHNSLYMSFKAGGIRLDIRDLRPADVISIALPPERQDQQNVTKLRG